MSLCSKDKAFKDDAKVSYLIYKVVNMEVKGYLFLPIYFELIKKLLHFSIEKANVS